MSEKELFDVQKEAHKIQRGWETASALEKAQHDTCKTIIGNI